jgi:N-acetylmuramoyl-L-alanine amidase
VRTLSLGDRGKEVIDVQQRLYALGFDLGGEGLDGFLGRRTQAALRAFQQRRGLIVDGSVGANTWRELVEAGYELGERLLYLRVPPFRGDDVLGLEVKLNLLGFNAGPERGIFDQAVDHAVKEFQRNAGLQPDGVVGEATLAMLDAVRKAESGREGKKIPERDEGYVAARALTGQTVVIDPGHGGADHGVIGGHGLREKDYTLALSLRLAQLLRAEGCRVRLTRERDERVGTYARAELADAARADFFLSLHLAAHPSPEAHGAACYYFERNHYFSEHGRRIADCLCSRLAALGLLTVPPMGRNYAALREPRAISVAVEPLFASHPGDEERALRPDHSDSMAGALLAGLTDYLVRSTLPQDASR